LSSISVGGAVVWEHGVLCTVDTVTAEVLCPAASSRRLCIAISVTVRLSSPADHATLTVAERACRTADCVDPARVSRPCGGVGETHLRHLLANYATYYNGVRTHLALDKDAPLHRPAQTVGFIASVTWPGGLHRHYVRMA